MNFGLRNAAQTFQRFIHEILRELPFVFVYIDDLLVFLHSREEHLQHLQTIFSLLAASSVTINLDKSTFAQSSVSFLGYTISAQG